ncbi:MAG: hypothetical protein FWD76_03175 [Firmicutes bacterium]|nr:hypothetical protein [Bacillota bacterium]
MEHKLATEQKEILIYEIQGVGFAELLNKAIIESGKSKYIARYVDPNTRQYRHFKLDDSKAIMIDGKIEYPKDAYIELLTVIPTKVNIPFEIVADPCLPVDYEYITVESNNTLLLPQNELVETNTTGQEIEPNNASVAVVENKETIDDLIEICKIYKEQIVELQASYDIGVLEINKERERVAELEKLLSLHQTNDDNTDYLVQQLTRKGYLVKLIRDSV